MARPRTTSKPKVPPSRAAAENGTKTSDIVFIRGVPPFDGEYDIDPFALNGYEYELVKQMSGVRAGEFPRAMLAGDYAFMIALAVVALERAGHAYVGEARTALMEAVNGSVFYIAASQQGGPSDPRPEKTPDG